MKTVYFMLAFSRNTLQPNPVLVELFETLQRRQFAVELGVGAELMMDSAEFTVRHDLYVLKSHTALWLSLAGIVHGQGGRILNPYLSCLAAHNKIVAERRMETSGIPTPQSWVTGDLSLLRAVSAERALIIKPYVGGRGVGVVLAQCPQDLAALAVPEQPVLVQEYIPGDELKVYVIGEHVFGVRKHLAASGSVRAACRVSDEVRAIALRCGQVFGLGLYGLDVIEGPAGPVVIDLNYFPSYKGVPRAAALLAAYIEEYIAGGSPDLAPTDLRRTSEPAVSVLSSAPALARAS